MKPKNRLPATNGSNAKSQEPRAESQKAQATAMPPLTLPADHAQAIMLHLERICRGGISADATDSVSAIKGILVQAAQASRAPQPAPTS